MPQVHTNASSHSSYQVLRLLCLASISDWAPSSTTALSLSSGNAIFYVEYWLQSTAAMRWVTWLAAAVPTNTVLLQQHALCSAFTIGCTLDDAC